MHFLKHELVAATVAFSLCACGCVKNHITVPAPVPNPPAQLGATVYPSLQTQEENGEASDFVVYEHEFVQGTSRLNPEGESHLRQIAVRAPHTPFPVIVEHVSPDVSTDDPCYVACTTLDAQRRQAVTAALTMMGVPGAHGRVISGPALTAGLRARQTAPIMPRQPAEVTAAEMEMEMVVVVVVVLVVLVVVVVVVVDSSDACIA